MLCLARAGVAWIVCRGVVVWDSSVAFAGFLICVLC